MATTRIHSQLEQHGVDRLEGLAPGEPVAVQGVEQAHPAQAALVQSLGV
jgi:hypothetical protein